MTPPYEPVQASPLSVGTVTVTPDPTLMAADPGAMVIAAGQFTTGAHQLYEVFQTSATATTVLLGGWHGHGADGFRTASQETNQNSQYGAEALIGTGNALKALARAITDAQAKARQAMTLAEHTNQAAITLANAYETASQKAVSALPPDAPSEVVVAASQPTLSQTAQANQLVADGGRAQLLMHQANTEAQVAWRQASVAFDAVTAQSPSVQMALLKARVKAFNSTMSSVAVLTLGIAISGSLSGEIPGGEEEEDDDIIPTGEGTSLDSEMAAEELAAGDGVKVDGTELDKDVAFIGNSDGVIKAEDAEMGALGDPLGGHQIDDPTKQLESSGALAFLTPALTDDVGATPGDLPSTAPTTVAEAPPGWTAPPASDARNFSGPVEPTVLEPGVTYYRVVGAGSSPDGSWWTTTPPTAADRSGLAIKGSWNSMSGVVEFTPASAESGIPAWHGAAAPQQVILPDGKPGYLPGGADQIWIPKGAVSNNNGTFTIKPMGGG
jgi:uncharacterized protein YukE